MHETVAIIGGGVAGLTAAHELVERGFKVDVYERRAGFGGKAASRRLKGPDGLPGEHGFRFFPSWYSHLTDTMARIPYHPARGGRQTVADNLVGVRTNLLAWFDRAPVELPLHLPAGLAEAAATSQFVTEFSRLGLGPGEVTFFFKKILEFVVLPTERQLAALESMTWWQYLECDQPGRSRAYKDLVRATTRTMVAAKAEEASAFTIGRIAVRTLLDTLSSVDRVLNGPSSEVWFDPWVDHLKARGVVFHTEMELQAIRFDAARRSVTGVVMEPVPVSNARRLRRIISRALNGQESTPIHDLEDAAALVRDLAASPWIAERASKPDGVPADALARDLASHRYLRSDLGAAQYKALEAQLAQVEARYTEAPVAADYFVLALPLEQLAYYVNRTTMLTFLAPELRDVVRLSRHMDWMAGIQFYLESHLDIVPGHIVGLDSAWALTAIEHTQFWKDVTLPKAVKGVLSVDISAWDKKGRTTRKEAYNCSPEEIAHEVWEQLKEMLNKLDRPPVLSDKMLVGGSLKRGHSFHLDDSVIELRDRKKQAFYEHARGLRFSTFADADDGGAEADAGAGNEDGYMWGPRRLFNAEPLLVNRAGSHKLRPNACTSIPNLFLAGDFIKTETDIACMEGANEAARRAVNGILDAAGSRKERCRIWPFAPSRQAIEAVMSMGGALRAVRGAAVAVAQLQDRLWKGLALGIMRVRGSGSAVQSSDRWIEADEETHSRR